MEATTLAGFIVVSLIGIATPGPDVMLAMSNGSRYGVRRSIPGIAGVAFADLFLMSAVAFGFGAILAASELFFMTIKLLGVAYLTYLGIRLITVRAVPVQPGATDVLLAADLSARIFSRSFFVTLTNIKAWLFFAAFLPQFVDAGLPQMPQYFVLAFVFEIISVVVLLAYAAVGASAVLALKGTTALWMDRASGAVLLVLAFALMLYQRGTLV